MKRVLVTGINGFIGRHVAAPLQARGYEVHGVTSAPQANLSGVETHVGDLLSPGAAEQIVAKVRPTHLLHLAWLNNPGRAMMSIDNVRWVATSLELFRAFVEAGGQRSVMAGSCAEYDWSFPDLHEARTPLRPHSIYGAAKNALREVVEAVGRQAGVSTAWARLFFLFGPHEPPGRLVSEIAAGLVQGQVIRTTEGHQQRDFLHVADAGEALAQLLDSSVSGVVNVASGQCVPVRTVIDTLGELSGRADLLAIGARPTSPDEPMRLAADVGRLRIEVGFAPKYPLEQGLAATLQWWQAGGNARQDDLRGN